MNQIRKSLLRLMVGIVVFCAALFMAGCSNAPAQKETAESETRSNDDEAEMLMLPELTAAELNNEPLRVVATTSIIGDVVSQVGGDAIELTTLLGPGQDPHSYVPAAHDLTAVAGADVIFINGWDLEEGLAGDLQNIGEGAPIVPISANIKPLAFGDAGHDLEADPHVWFNIHNVEQWVDNAQHVLSNLDPSHAAVYEGNAAGYRVELDELAAYAESQLAGLGKDNRFLVTNHDSFSYFADAYGFTVLGTVVPAASTLAEPSASDLAKLIKTMEANGLCTIFTETAVSDTLAQTVAGELTGCDEVKVLQLYTGSVGPAGSGADSYTGMFRTNIDSVVTGLKQRD